PVEPPGVRALPGRRARVDRWRGEEIAQIEVGVAPAARPDVEVDQLRPAGPSRRAAGPSRRAAAGRTAAGPAVASGQAGLLGDLPDGRLRGRLAGLEVAARLQPDPEDPVEVEEHAPLADH